MQNPRGDLRDYLLGQVGKDIVTGAASSPGGMRYVCLHAIADTVITAMTDATLKTGSAAITLKAGDKYYGDISAVTISSGTLICYWF